MESCLLCLKINNDALDCIRVNSRQWQEQDILKTIKKHFWSMKTIHPTSSICVSCWREVDCFHKFYLRIEEAHANFGKIKVEDCPLSIDCKEELTVQKSNFKSESTELDNDYMTCCFLEPEILLQQTQGKVLTEPEILVDQQLVHVEEPGTSKPIDETDIYDKPHNQSCKRQKLLNNVLKKDPLAKSDKWSVSLDNENIIDDFKIKVKEEPLDSNDNDSDSLSEGTDDTAGNPSEKVKNKSNGKLRTKREENDLFIAEHFKQMFCDLCQVPFTGFPSMQKHFLDVHRQRGYVVCCKKKYFNRRLLVDHIHCHLNPDYFKCDQCGKVMSDRLRLEKHILCVHGPEELKKKQCCEKCGKSFANNHYLRMHKLTHLSEEEKKFQCKECGKFYGSSCLLHRHMQAVHLKKFVKICYICGKFISCSTDYKMHMNKHEGIPEPIINCDVCGLRITTERGLKRHKETQHPVDGKKEHHCPKCPKISPTLKALRKHISTMHEKGFDHKCTICQKAFKRAEVLREHMASHTGTPLYTCSWCPKTFNSNGNMHAHRKKVHPKEWEEAKLQKYSGNVIANVVNEN